MVVVVVVVGEVDIVVGCEIVVDCAAACRRSSCMMIVGDSMAYDCSGEESCGERRYHSLKTYFMRGMK